MARYTKTSLGSNYASKQQIDTNLDDIKTAIDDTLSRKGDSPNAMEADLDMNSNRILNLPNAINPAEPVTLAQFNANSGGTKTTSTLRQLHTATAGQTVFSTPEYVIGSNNLSVYINGVRQNSEAYSETTTTSITLSEGAELGDKVEVLVNELQESTDQVGATNVTYDGTTVGVVLDDLTRREVVADKAAAVLLDPSSVDYLIVYSKDGGVFKSVTGAVATYSDDSASYCGKVFIPSGGDGSKAFERIYTGNTMLEWYGLGQASDAGAVIQEAIDGLNPTYGGTISALEGRDTISSGATIDRATFTNGGVVFDFPRRRIFDVTGAITAITFTSSSGATPLDRCGWQGGQLVSAHGDANGAILLNNVSRFQFSDRTLISGFRASTGAGTRYGVKVQYGLWCNYSGIECNNCDKGLWIQQDITASYRSTTSSIQSSNFRRCAVGIQAMDVFSLDIDESTSIENCSVGLYISGDKTSGTNCSNVNVNAYFERNGTHIYAKQNTSAVNRGIAISNCTLELISGTYVDTEAFDSSIKTPNQDKIEIECDNSVIEDNAWSSAAPNNDILITAGSDNKVLSQGSPIAGLTITDNATDTQMLWTHELGQVQNTLNDATPDVTNITIMQANYNTPTNVTNFDGGYIGQSLYVRHLNSNVTYVHGSLILPGGVNKTTATNDGFHFVRISSTQWLMVGN